MASLPSPEPQLTYTFDPYALPSDARAYLGTRLSQYKLLVDAVLNRQEQITLGKNSTVAAISCLYSEFPLSVLLRDFTFSEDMSTLTLIYAFDAAKHSACITAFKARTREVLLTTVRPGYNECERALVLYRWTAQNITYLDGEDVSPYHALMDGVGICQSFEGVYRYLLLQLGIDVLSGSAMTTENAAHAWSIVKLGGGWYHMDPTFECSVTQGAGLRYFGMADYDRLVSGMMVPFKTGVDDWNNTAVSCEDSRFAALYRCTRWELESDAHRGLAL